MGFVKLARARVTQPVINQVGWGEIRAKSSSPPQSFELRQAAQVILQQYDPKQYLLSHSTIIASVDTEHPGVPTGSQMADGFQIDRRFSDFYITQGTQKFINNNYDAFERKVLLSSYRTFIGGENYCFLPGTHVVMSDGMLRALEDIKVGDIVLTHTGSRKRVLRTFTRDVNEEICALYFDQSQYPVRCTLNHPFLSISKSWDVAGDLRCGALFLGPELSSQDGDVTTWYDRARVHTLQWSGRETYYGPVYNIEVEEDNSYVLSNGIAVHNCEHIQIPELSKGKIIDAAARDIGDSVYVDILIATDRKHKSLIDAITSGQLSTLSMGAQVSYTQCTKCGNVADDEHQLCPHIKFEKGSTFIDAKGNRRKVAELCGHASDPNSVKFIEGSWVANPAFTGAVLRTILDPNTALLADAAKQKIQVVFSSSVKEANPSLMQKTAGKSRHLATQQDYPDQAETDGGQGQTPEEGGNPFKKTIDDLYRSLVKEVVEKAHRDLSQGEQEKNRGILDENSSNQSLIKSALHNPKWRERAKIVFATVREPVKAQTILAGLILHDFGGWKAVATRRFTGREILVIDRFLTRMLKKSSMAGDGRVYRTVIAVGGTAPYKDVVAYFTACREVMGRTPTRSERIQLLEKGKLFALGV
jgi:hypothetical protein